MTNPVVYFLSIELLNHRSFIFALSHFFFTIVSIAN